MTAVAIEQSDVNAERVSKRPAHLWKPGQSGNPGGKPRGVAELRRKLLRLEPKARKRLMELIESANEEVAFKALALYFAYALGKPPENIDLAKMDMMRDRMRSVMAEVVKTESLPLEREEATTPVEPQQTAALETPSAPPSPEATDVVTPVSVPSGLRCLYRGKDGQCPELAPADSQWCLPHRQKLFSMVSE